MSYGLVMDHGFIERLTDKPGFINIVVGTGALARDMQVKLGLLGLKAPLLIGGKPDPERGILHYGEVSGLGDPKQFRFIICCEENEWDLIYPAQTAIYRFLGISSDSHPQLLRFSSDYTLISHADGRITDAVNGYPYLRGGLPYTVIGDGQPESFHIHLLGGCRISDVFQSIPKTVPQQLYEQLKRAGFRSTVYAWGQPASPVGDSVLRALRSVVFHPCDLLILYSAELFRSSVTDTKNLLYTRTGKLSPKNVFTQQLQQSYKHPVSNGIDHDTDLISLRKSQQRVFTALARHYGFAFWDVIAPTSYNLESGAKANHNGRSPGFLQRQKAKQDALLAVLDGRVTKDYRNLFWGISDIHALFSDARHYSEEGNRIVAERLAGDIIKSFKKED